MPVELKATRLTRVATRVRVIMVTRVKVIPKVKVVLKVKVRLTARVGVEGVELRHAPLAVRDPCYPKRRKARQRRA